MKLALLFLAACVDAADPTCAALIADTEIVDLGDQELRLKFDGSTPYVGDYYTCPDIGAMFVRGTVRQSADGRSIIVERADDTCRLAHVDRMRTFSGEVCQ